MEYSNAMLVIILLNNTMKKILENTKGEDRKEEHYLGGTELYILYFWSSRIISLFNVYLEEQDGHRTIQLLTTAFCLSSRNVVFIYHDMETRKFLKQIYRKLHFKYKFFIKNMLL